MCVCVCDNFSPRMFFRTNSSSDLTVSLVAAVLCFPVASAVYLISAFHAVFKCVYLPIHIYDIGKHGSI